MKLFFIVTLDQSKLRGKIQQVYVPRTLLVLLCRDEVARLLAAFGNQKQTAVSVARGAGLLGSEGISLKVTSSGIVEKFYILVWPLNRYLINTIDYPSGIVLAQHRE